MAETQRWLALPTQLARAEFEQFVLPHLSIGSRGPAPKLSLYKIFNYVLKILYLGCQWKELPIHKDGEGRPETHYTRIYRIWRRWVDDGCMDARSPSGDDRGTRPAGLAGLDRLRSTVLSRNDDGPLQDTDRTAAASPRLCGPTDRSCHRRGGAKPDVGGRTPGFGPSPAGHRITAWGGGHLAFRLEVHQRPLSLIRVRPYTAP